MNHRYHKSAGGVYALLADRSHAGHPTSLVVIMGATGYTQRSADRILRELERGGYILNLGFVRPKGRRDITSDRLFKITGRPFVAAFNKSASTKDKRAPNYTVNGVGN